MIIYFLTKNRGKLREARTVLSKFGIEVEQLKEDREEIQSEDLEEIAIHSIRNVKAHKLPIVVEDAGLFINALNGFPGPYSSYVYKTIGCRGILKLMKDVKNREAMFKSAVAYTDGKTMNVFIGKVEGVIAFEERGQEGFGFDPIFIPSGYNETFAEMGFERKCLISHRAKAFEAFGSWLLKRKVNNMNRRG